MPDTLIIERLEFQGRCGITPEERRHPQPMAIDLELDCDIAAASSSDRIVDAVDYATVAERIAELGTTQESALLETFAQRVVGMLFAEFPINRARIWLRKLAPPLLQTTGSVGIRVERTRQFSQGHSTDPVPSGFLKEHVDRLPKGRVLDVACGSGRHALYLASRGFDVEAIDRDNEALSRLAATARQRNLPNLTVKTVDLERATSERPEFPSETYDVLLVSFYLHRPLFPWMIDALKPSGILLYETFTIDNYIRHRHPRRWEFCLAHNELLRLTSALRVLSYDEGEHEAGPGKGAVFTARLIAQKAGPTYSTYEPD
ncbi:MAG TPA: dihydroneopterin aldolase [Nitrospira sp.]